jgi:hypothetical protein
MATGTEKAYFGNLEFGMGDEPPEALFKKLPGIAVIGEPGPGKAEGPENLACPAGGIFPEFLKNLRNQAGRIILGEEGRKGRRAEGVNPVVVPDEPAGLSGGSRYTIISAETSPADWAAQGMTNRAKTKTTGNTYSILTPFIAKGL